MKFLFEKLKSKILLLFTAPKGVDLRFQRYYVSTNSIYVLAGLIHFLFIFFFAIVGAPELMYFNMGSVLWFVLSIWINRKQFLVTSLYMCFSEVFAHAIVATIYFGWGAGYQYYALLFSTGIFLLPPGRIIQKFSSILIACIAFSGLFYYSSTHPPIYVWESPYLEIVNVSNIIFSSLFHAGFAYYFTWSANQAENSLENEHKAQTAFFQNISHELRTPLTLISGPAEIAFRKGETINNDELKMIVNNARRLTRLVNQLLDIQKITAGKMSLQTESIEVSKYIQTVLESFLPYSTKKNIQLEAIITTSELYVDADIEQIDKCIYNFVSNALKFTPTGGRIVISLERNESDVIVSVTDNGVGIEEKQLQRLFSRYGISTASLTREQEGTGLGLSLVKEIIELHGGKVGCVSKLNEGSKFFFTLPLSKNQTPAKFVPSLYKSRNQDLTEFQQTKPSNTNTTKINYKSGLHILIVEDNPDLRSYLGSIFTREGFRTSVASDGQEGFEMAIELKPDLIITDLMMPKKSGLDLIQDVRRTSHITYIPIILLTAKADEQTRKEVTEEGANFFLAKPFSDIELISIVNNAIKLKENERYLEKEKIKLQKLQSNFLQTPPSHWSSLKIDLIFQPTEIVSGDYYFFQDWGNGNYGVHIFDVSGHGVAAGVIVGMLHLILSSPDIPKDNPGNFLEHINQILYSHTGGYFVTGISLFYDTKKKSVQIARAGHPNPIYIQNDNIKNLDYPAGKALGIFPDAQIQFLEFPVQSNDDIFLYSDGWIEIANSEQKFWEGNGWENTLIESNRFPNFSEFVLQQASAFHGDNQFEDDLTLIRIKIL
ncbi:MAG: SpoIIE family protein phosphatase [Leptospiraceae bacterium]|nr:SpoIIE family protein phosphatase [Leptospiraceae bacterium]